MRRMNGRLDFAMTLFRVRRYMVRSFFIRQFKFAIHLAQPMQTWPPKAALWHPPTGWNQNFDNKLFFVKKGDQHNVGMINLASLLRNILMTKAISF